MLTDLPIGVGAYRPEMLDLVSREADGWLPTLHHLLHVLRNERRVTSHPRMNPQEGPVLPNVTPAAR